MQLSQLLAALPTYQFVSNPNNNPIIHHITADSRQVGPGTLFVAYRGVSLDSHRFIPEAIAKGASAIVGESLAMPMSDASPALITVPNGREALAFLAAAWSGFPAQQLKMVGITGTDGKTTTTNLLYHILRAGGHKVSMISTVNAVIGDQVLDTGLHTTTPDSPDVQRYLAQMLQAGANTCLLEVTSHGMAHYRVASCEFDVAIVTNITHEHLDLHGSLAEYRAAKARLFESLATAKDKGSPKMAILNCDDGSFEYLKAKLTPLGISWLGYSLVGHPEAALTARNVVYKPDKTHLVIQGLGAEFAVETQLVGDYNVSNCLAATAAALGPLKLPPKAVQRGLAALAGIPGRMERINAGQPFIALVDFAHTPNALRRSLQVARTLSSGRVIAVFGCAGLRDVEKRTLMGQFAAELADYTIITAEDPRTEDLDQIIEATAQAMQALSAVEGVSFERVPDRGQAIFRAVQLAGPNDVVIACGKGHEQSMCFGVVEYPWDDRQAMRAALSGQPLLTLPTAHQ
jgi:UDP-N-acetylmuramoyl-L-alanyl-D-glutamate--2,6-diaminopimelate ligase